MPFPFEGVLVEVVALADILIRPQRLEVGVMEALTLLVFVKKVERVTRPSVIYVPHSKVFPVIVPSHTLLELLFQVLSAFLDGAAQ